ncbi:beta-ketoacyl-[acyl-carrier-protein] synthase II, partial [Streptococcus suis]
YAPKTAGTTDLSEDIEADVSYGQGRDMEIRHAISNTFGFGGPNSVIAFKRWEA